MPQPPLFPIWRPLACSPPSRLAPVARLAIGMAVSALGSKLSALTSAAMWRSNGVMWREKANLASQKYRQKRIMASKRKKRRVKKKKKQKLMKRITAASENKRRRGGRRIEMSASLARRKQWQLKHLANGYRRLAQSGLYQWRGSSG